MSQPNHIIFPLTRTPEREPHYDWTIKVASIELVFITLAGQPLSMEEARLLPRITVQQDTPFEQYLKERGFENLESVTEPARAQLHLLRTHRVQAWFTAKDLAYYARLVHDIDADLIYSEPVETYDVYIATSRQFPGSLGKAYAETFQTIVTDGTYARIMARYQR
jgi:polar amino acid transport system substrate-binding protein